MQNIPGRDDDITLENFAKAISVLTISIVGWIDEHAEESDASNTNAHEKSNKAELLLQATDHLRQYGITGARATSIAVLAISSLWARCQIKRGKADSKDQKSEMSWVMKSPAVQAAIQETFKPLDTESKRDTENFAQGTELIIKTFVNCALDKFDSRYDSKLIEGNREYVEKLKELRVFFDAIDEGGLSYIAKVLELVAPTVMISKNFNYQSNATVSDYYENVAEFFEEIFVSSD